MGRCGRDSAEMSLHLLKRQRLPTFSSESLVEQALAIALTFERSAYDSIYVALALIREHNLLPQTKNWQTPLRRIARKMARRVIACFDALSWGER